MGYMIQVVGLEIGIPCKRLIAGYSENYYPLRLYMGPARVFIIHQSPAALFEPSPLIEPASLLDKRFYCIIFLTLIGFILSILF